MSAPRYIAREWQCHAATSVGYEIDGRFHQVAECSGFGRSSEEAEHSAAQIVVALNSHADLLEAARALVQWAENAGHHSQARSAVGLARAAVAKASGGAS